LSHINAESREIDDLRDMDERGQIEAKRDAAERAPRHHYPGGQGRPEAVGVLTEKYAK